jgi:integrase/recombinase XerD
MAPIMADHVEAFLRDSRHRGRLSTNTLRAYQYELQAAADHFLEPRNQITLDNMETWASRGGVAPSTIGRRTASLSRFFSWAIRQGLCASNPLLQHEPSRPVRWLPRPSNEI